MLMYVLCLLGFTSVAISEQNNILGCMPCFTFIAREILVGVHAQVVSPLFYGFFARQNKTICFLRLTKLFQAFGGRKMDDGN
jgi:hypothetical protein